MSICCSSKTICSIIGYLCVRRKEIILVVRLNGPGDVSSIEAEYELELRQPDERPSLEKGSHLHTYLIKFKEMPLSKNDIRALSLIAGSEEPVNPRILLEELGFRRETLSRLLTHLEKQGLVERRGREATLAGTPTAEAFKKLYYSHRASPS
jgi:CRP-like cAMP-binding protein